MRTLRIMSPIKIDRIKSPGRRREMAPGRQGLTRKEKQMKLSEAKAILTGLQFEKFSVTRTDLCHLSAYYYGDGYDTVHKQFQAACATLPDDSVLSLKYQKYSKPEIHISYFARYEDECDLPVDEER